MYQQGSLSNKMRASANRNAKMETPYSKSSNKFYCELCKISCTSERRLADHYGGQKHKKREFNLKNEDACANRFYCEVCKLSCNTERNYKDHCGGQKHKKKELKLKNNPSGSSYFCELCIVRFHELDSFNIHLNGKPHIKACKIQAKLANEVPQHLVAPTTAHQPSATSSTTNENTIKVIGSLETMTSYAEAVREEVRMDVERDEEQQTNDEEENKSSVLDGGKNDEQTDQTTSNEISNLINNSTSNDIPPQHDNSSLDYSTDPSTSAESIGTEYVAEYKLPSSRTTYWCLLCNCSLSSIAAKEMHVQGKPHQKNYKSQNKSSQTRSPIAKTLSATKTMLGQLSTNQAPVDQPTTTNSPFAIKFNEIDLTGPSAIQFNETDLTDPFAIKFNETDLTDPV